MTMPEQESETILKTSAEWQEKFPNPLVYDPDGWDRKNFYYSWFEERITQQEYERRVMNSTLMSKVKDE